MTDSEKALAAALDKGGFKPKPRPNSTKAVHALNGAHALLAKALLYVKQAKDELGDVRIREPMVYPLITDVDAVLTLIRSTMADLTHVAETPRGLALKTETPEEGP